MGRVAQPHKLLLLLLTLLTLLTILSSRTRRWGFWDSGLILIPLRLLWQLGHLQCWNQKKSWNVIQYQICNLHKIFRMMISIMMISTGRIARTSRMTIARRCWPGNKRPLCENDIGVKFGVDIDQPSCGSFLLLWVITKWGNFFRKSLADIPLRGGGDCTPHFR